MEQAIVYIGIEVAKAYFDCPTNVCSKQSAYGCGAGVAAARGHLDVPVVRLEPSVVSDVGLRFSSGVGVGVASDFGLAPWPARCLAPCPAPWSAPAPLPPPPPAPWLAPCPPPWLAPCPAPFECRPPEGCGVGALKLLSAPCL